LNRPTPRSSSRATWPATVASATCPSTFDARQRACHVISMDAQMYPHDHPKTIVAPAPRLSLPGKAQISPCYLCPRGSFLFSLHVVVVCSAIGLGARSCDQYETCAEMDVAAEGLKIRYGNSV
jgi:hypothetical protein